MFEYDRKERASWGLTLTQPSTTESRLGGSFSFVKLRRAATGRYTKLVNRFRQPIEQGRPQLASAVGVLRLATVRKPFNRSHKYQ
jgi:hypothetical protein